MVSVGGMVYLACDNKYCGALLFSIALVTICMFGFSLYTGKIGFIVQSHGKDDFIALAASILGNVAGSVLFAFIAKAACPVLYDKSLEICLAKLTQTNPQAFFKGFLCGILMYVAVWIYRRKNTALGILFCIPVFILSGFEHSIADMFYFAFAGLFNAQSAVYIILIVLGNTAGAIFISLLNKISDLKTE